MKTSALLIITLIVLVQCAQKNQFPRLTGAYLGQSPPGITAQIFAPGIVSTALNDRDQTFAPDMSEIIFGVLEKPHSVLVSMKYKNGDWSAQQILPFSGKYNDCEPQFSPDGQRLYFCSERPLHDGEKPKDYDIWYVDRTESGWGKPQNPGPPLNSEKNEFYPSVTRNGTLYFTSHDMKIYKSRLTEKGFTKPEVLSDSINSGVAEYNAFIAPDESYLIFTSHGWPGGRNGRGDLFISFMKSDSSWSRAVSLGPRVNSSTIDMSPTVSPDGKYLFYASPRTSEEYDPEPITSYDEIFRTSNKIKNGKSNIYWVSTAFIDSIKSEIHKIK